MTPHAYVTLPRRFLWLVAPPKPEPKPYTLVRPDAEAVRDVERWLRLEGTLWGTDLDDREGAARRLLFVLWLIRQGRVSDG
jgi:hypothetical protein